MELVFACFRVSLAVAFVVIGGYSAQADGAGSGAAAIGDAARAETSAAAVAPFGGDQLAETNSGDPDCAHPCSSNCAHSGGLGCCAPSILVDHLPALVPIATAGGDFDAADSVVTGTDPEAPQEPPQNAA